MAKRPVKLMTIAELDEMWRRDPDALFRVVNRIMSVHEPDYEKLKANSKRYAKESWLRQKAKVAAEELVEV